MAYALGIPTIRVNTGRWGTTKSFDELMANKGIEPRLPGYTDEDGFGWVIDGLAKCLKTAERCGVVMGLEFNHEKGAMHVMKALYDNGVWAIFSTLDPRVLQFKPGILYDRFLCEEVLNRLETAVGQARSAAFGGARRAA